MTLTGEQLARVTDAVIGIWARHHGHGPDSGKSFLNDQLLVTVLRGGLTRQERTLVERGRSDLVRHMRMEFEEVMRPEFDERIREITGRAVRDYQSQVLVEAGVTVELFLLE